MMTERCEALSSALERRSDWLAQMQDDGTTCLRLLHGAVEGAPGTTIDRYGDVLLVQTWREPLVPGELDALHQRVDRVLPGLTAVWNNRDSGRRKGSRRPFSDDHDPELPEDITGTELGVHFHVHPRHRGRDPLLFLDFRAGRRHIRSQSHGKSVLNLFAYTCGMGVVAGLGGASHVLNVDFASSSLGVGQRNADLNDVDMDVLHADCLPVIRQYAGLSPGGRRGRRPRYAKVDRRQWDLIILDPPRWARSAFGAVDVVRDYPTLFKPTLLATAPGGHILATNNVASVDWADWVDVLTRCANKAGRPLGTIERIEVDSDFPTFDGKAPLKMAWIAVP